MTRDVRRAGILAALLLGGPLVLARPGDAPEEPAPPSVAALVTQLGSPDYRTREAAGARLRAAGDPALPALRAALRTTTDLEIARRVEVLIEEFDDRRLRRARRVTLALKQKPVQEVVAALAKASGYAIVYTTQGENAAANPEATKAARERIDFAVENLPFLEALDRLAERIDCSVAPTDDADSYTLTPGASSSTAVAYEGPFRVVATDIQAQRNLKLLKTPQNNPQELRNQQLTLTLAVTSELKVPMLGLGGVEVVGAVDNEGRTFAAAVPPGPNGVPDVADDLNGAAVEGFNRTNLYQTNVTLPLPERSAHTIKELKLRLAVTVMRDTRVTTYVDDIAKAKGKTWQLRDHTVEFTKVEADKAGAFAVEFTARRATTDENANENYWYYRHMTRLQLVDDKGAEYRLANSNFTETTPATNSVRLDYQRPSRKPGPAGKAGKPARLQMVEWVPHTQVITFTLKDVPLP